MPQFYFDYTDGNVTMRDNIGVSIPGASEARTMAARALSELARDRLTGGHDEYLTIEVRDDFGRVFKASLAFSVSAPPA